MPAEYCQLTTYGHEDIPEIPWDVYPRPQLKRNSFINLNGWWDFTVQSVENDPAVFPERNADKIRVPYPVESKLSGIQKHFPEGTALWYRRDLPSVSLKENERLLLHIDAVDQEADIYINDQFVSHIHTFEGYGGIDITSFLREQNTLTVCVTDDLNRKEFPYGKQTLKRGGMWYTPFSGIWQSVWMEIVPENHIQEIQIEPGLSEAKITVFPAKNSSGDEDGYLLFEGKKIPLVSGSAALAPNDPVCWTPEDPRLYNFTIHYDEDEVESYFALRTLSIQDTENGRRLCLNGKPYFFHGLLDQGYWPDGICTPPDPSCFAEDIRAMIALGFNTLRKHIKREPSQFYYECDRLGMIVFQDMINNGCYSFFRDTLLPTIGIRKLNDSKTEKEPKVREMFNSSMRLMVSHLINYPSICLWTIFNEGWGQFESCKAYEELKELDPSRFIDTASGWFHPEQSDVESLHVYFKQFRMPRSEKPVLLSEFGGYSLKLKDHSFNLKKTYGYRFYKETAAFQTAVEKLYREEILPSVKAGLSGAIYTQVSDVEDETNGLLTYDRAICKVDKKVFSDIAKILAGSHPVI